MTVIFGRNVKISKQYQTCKKRQVEEILMYEMTSFAFAWSDIACIPIKKRAALLLSLIFFSNDLGILSQSSPF